MKKCTVNGLLSLLSFLLLLLIILLRTKAAHNMSQLQTPEKTPETKK